MNIVKQFRYMVRIAEALESIAASLVYFATVDARANGLIFNPKPQRYATDQSDLLHTYDPATMNKIRQQEADLISSRGFKYLDELESVDE